MNTQVTHVTQVTPPPNPAVFLQDGGPLYPVIEEYLFRTTNALAGLRLLEGYLKKWRKVGRITTKEFETLYIVICRAGLFDWIDWDLDSPYEEVTGHLFDLDYMRKLAKSNLPTETPPYREINMMMDKLKQ